MTQLSMLNGAQLDLSYDPSQPRDDDGKWGNGGGGGGPSSGWQKKYDAYYKAAKESGYSDAKAEESARRIANTDHGNYDGPITKDTQKSQEGDVDVSNPWK